jgi:hypothetical protein
MSVIRINAIPAAVGDIAGQRFNKLVALDFCYQHPRKGCHWLFRCDCGTEKFIVITNVLSDGTRSCGCLRRGVKKRPFQGERRRWPNLEDPSFWWVRLHRIYSGMKDRCCNPNSRAYRYYGGRGITICKEWLEDREAFIDWAMENGYHYTLQIDRIDNYRGYGPGNCRWITPQQQQKNKRIHQDARMSSTADAPPLKST